MGRKKLEIKRIENTSSRQVTFSKRRNGLIKKAREISVLCDAEVALVIFSTRGRRFEFCSSTSLSKILERYLNQLEMEPGKHGCANAKHNQESATTLNQLQEKFQSQLEESSIDQLSITDLVQLETRLDATLHRIRLRKTQLAMDSLSALKDQERSLILENELLGREVEILASENNGGNSSRMAVEFL